MTLSFGKNTQYELAYETLIELYTSIQSNKAMAKHSDLDH